MFGFGKVENIGIIGKCVGTPHFHSFLRWVGVTIPHIIVVGTLVEPFFLFFQDMGAKDFVGFQYSVGAFHTIVVFLPATVGFKSPISFFLVVLLLSWTLIGACKQLDLSSMSLMNYSTMLRTFATSSFLTVLEKNELPLRVLSL